MKIGIFGSATDPQCQALTRCLQKKGAQVVIVESQGLNRGDSLVLENRTLFYKGQRLDDVRSWYLRYMMTPFPARFERVDEYYLFTDWFLDYTHKRERYGMQLTWMLLQELKGVPVLNPPEHGICMQLKPIQLEQIKQVQDENGACEEISFGHHIGIGIESMNESKLLPFKTPDPELFNLRVGAILSPDNLVILAGLKSLEDEDTAHTVVLHWNGNEPWSGKLLNWSSGHVSAITNPDVGFLMAGIDGEFAFIKESYLKEGETDLNTITGLNSIRGFGAVLGLRTRVSMMNEFEDWNTIQYSSAGSHLLNDITAVSPHLTIAVGSDGVIVSVENEHASLCDSPTDLTLTSICSGPAGTFACGLKGLILRHSEHGWEVVEHDMPSENFWCIHQFQGVVYVASARFLFALVEGELVPVSFQGEAPGSFYHLSSFGDECLLSTGKNNAFRFDGSEWTRLI